jgi:glycosyltransferase involved in cell wall biosynthesis
MKILYLSGSGQLGGAESSLLNLLTGVQQECAEIEPVVVAPEEGTFTRACRELGVPCSILPMPCQLERFGDSQIGAGELLGKVFGAARLAGDFLRYARALRHLIRRERPAVIHTNGLKMHILGAWANRERVPLVGHIHDYVSTRRLAGKLLKFSAHGFSSFIANSQSVAEDVRSFLQFEGVHPIDNAVDTARFSPEGSRVDLDALSGLPPAAPGTVRVGLLATFARWKGHATFLRAIAQTNPAVRGYVIGGPIYRTANSQLSLKELHAEVRRLGLEQRVGFTGLIENAATAIRALDVVVHASTSPEPFGMVIIEAMACGRAVIVSQLGGATELFEDGVTALAHLAGDEESLAAAINRLATEPVLRERLAENGRRAALARFEPRDIARQVLAVYRQTAPVFATGALVTVP